MKSSTERKDAMKSATTKIELTEDLEDCLICAERYACGRQSYITGIVQDTIRSLIPKISSKVLGVIAKDLTPSEFWDGFYGDKNIDKPGWIQLRDEIRKELDRRKDEV